jgi:hypothetical protein
MYREKIVKNLVIISQPQNPTLDHPTEETDLLPEYCHYKDEGCKLAPACLSCPLPRCIDEQLQGRLKKSAFLRDKEILSLYTLEKKTCQELAAFFKVSQRTVRRAIASAKKKQNSKGQF